MGFLVILGPTAWSLRYGGVNIRPEVAKSFTLGHRLKADGLTKEELLEFEGKLPCVIERPFDLNDEKWCESMVQKLGDVMIEYDARDRGEGSSVLVETYECTLNEYLAALVEGSNHIDSMYFMRKKYSSLRKHEVFGQLELPEELFGKDLFKSFPLSIRPHSALIIGGAGSRSFLHADPYEWTDGTTALKEKSCGHFCPQSRTKITFLKTKRVPADFWGVENCSWVAKRHRSIPQHHRK